MEERKEQGAKSLFLRVWVGTQKIPIILKKIKYCFVSVDKVVYAPEIY